MSRTEEILKLIDEEMGIDGYGSCDFRVGVCYGVRHADKTMIEKACEWIKVNMPNYINFEEGFIYEVDMADDLRKAMEE